MFWQTKPVEENSLEVLLKKDTVVLIDVLDDPYLLQAVRIGDKNLLDYLTREDVLLEVMNNALKPTIDTTLPLEKQYRHSLICSEILSISSDEIIEAVFSSEVVLSVITDFMNDSSQVNHLIASFYMKIVTQLLSRNPEKMLEVLESGNFINRAIVHLHLSAIAELLLRLITTSYEERIGNKIKQWCVEHGLIENCLALLDPSFPSPVHDNVNYLWTELTRTLRENLYTQDIRQDPLLERMQSTEIIEDLIAKVINLDSCAGMCSSVITNVCSILAVLLETNFVPNCPSQQLADEKNGRWSCGIPGEGSTSPTDVWQPDGKREVETITARHVEKFLKLATMDLESETRSKAWFSLLQVIVELCNTAHLPTHQLLLEGFRKGQLQKLFALAVQQPTISVFHKQLHKIIAYIFFTSSTEVTPLLSYIFKELDIIGVIEAYINPSSLTLLPLELICIRAFHANLADLIITASKHGPNKSHVAEIINADDRWKNIHQEITTYKEANRPHSCVDPGSLSISSRSENQLKDDEEFFAPAQSMLAPLEMKIPMSRLPKHLNDDVFGIGEPLSSDLGEQGNSSPQEQTMSDNKKSHDATTPEEKFNSQFESNNSICFDDWPSTCEPLASSETKTTQNDADAFADWPQAESVLSRKNEIKTDLDEWPTSSNAGSEDVAMDQFPVDWNGTEGFGSPAAASSSIESASISPLHSDQARLTEDEWAFFSNTRSSSNPPSNQEDWPGDATGKQKPLNSLRDFRTAPTLNASSDSNSSEC